MPNEARDIPIIFSAPMIRALLDGRKTQTRRLESSPLRKAKPGDRLWVRESGCRSKAIFGDWGDIFRHDVPITAATGYYWVEKRRGPGASYNAANCSRASHLSDGRSKACPSIHMPRWASRITLVVEDVRIERLQGINEGDALAEGVPAIHEGSVGDEIFCQTCQGDGVHGALGGGYGMTEVDCEDCVTAKQKFSNLWNSLHAKPGERWEDNPLVVALTFSVHRCNIDEMDPTNG